MTNTQVAIDIEDLTKLSRAYHEFEDTDKLEDMIDLLSTISYILEKYGENDV